MDALSFILALCMPESAVSSATAAAESAAEAKAVQESIPEDYTALSNSVGDLRSAVTSLDEDVNGVILKNYTEGKNFTANSVSHAIIDDENACISDYISVTWGDNKIGFAYTDDTTDETVYQMWYFDANKDYLGYKGRNPTGQNTRDNISVNTSAAYIRISFKKGFTGKVFLNGNLSTVYYTATETITEDGVVQKIGDLSNLNTTEKTNLVGAINEIHNIIPEFPINPDDTTFFHISKNLINYAECTPNSIVNQETGSFGSGNGHNRTYYVGIQPSTQYVIREKGGAFGNGFRYFFYTSDKSPIPNSGAVGALPDMVLTTPATAAFIVISSNTKPQNMMIAAYENNDKSFEAYDNVYVMPKYIVSGDAESIVLNVPSKIYALVGAETNIYFENITDEYTNYDWDVSCSKGMQLERGYRITPVAADAGTYDLTIRASLSENIYKEITVSLIVTAESAGSGNTASIIIMGDSTTDNGTVITKLHDNFDADAMAVTTLGTRGTSPNNHEGRSGWTLNDYLTKASITYPSGDSRGTIYNPFYNPSTETFDASYYFTETGIAKPDYFVINMGINDAFGFANDVAMNSGIDTLIERMNTVVDSVLDATTETKVCVCLTIPPNHSQDAFGKAYGCSTTRNRCKRNNTYWVKKLIETYDNRENERIYLIPINTALDTVYNMGLETLSVNARNTDVTYQSPISNGGVHPVTSGYWQIADVYTAFLKAQASE